MHIYIYINKYIQYVYHVLLIYTVLSYIHLCIYNYIYRLCIPTSVYMIRIYVYVDVNISVYMH